MKDEERLNEIDESIVNYCMSYDKYDVKVQELEDKMQEGRIMLTKHRVKGGQLYFSAIWENGLVPRYTIDPHTFEIKENPAGDSAITKLAPIPTASMRTAQKHFNSCLFSLFLYVFCCVLMGVWHFLGVPLLSELIKLKKEMDSDIDKFTKLA